SLRRTEDSAVSSTTRSNFSSLTGSVTGIRFQRPQRPPGWHSSRLGALSRLQESVKTYFKKTSKCSSRRNTRTTSVSPRMRSWKLLRVHIDSLGRVAEADVRLFHFYIHERLRAAGVLGPALVEAVRAASMQLRPMIEPLMIFAHRKGMAKA